MPDSAQITRPPGTKVRNEMAGAFGRLRWRQGRRRLFILSFLGVVLVVYVALALRISAAKAPWIDEGWISISTLNFLEHGKTGNPVMDPGGFWIGDYLPGIRETNYLNMPLTLLIQALWFKIFGFGVLSMRALSMFWGAIAILVWFAIVELFAGRAAACLTAALLAVDFTFLSSAADGRMDMWCMCLWSLGLLYYLRLRNRSFTRALLVSNVFIAASVFTHPNGIIGIVLLAAFVWKVRRELRWSHIALLWPYVVGLGIWLAFIAASPSDFVAQFAVNSGRQSGKLNILSPWVSVLNEFWIRYVLHFGGGRPGARHFPKERTSWFSYTG